MKVKINYKRILQNHNVNELDKKYLHFCLLNQFKVFDAKIDDKFKNVKDANIYSLSDGVNDYPWIFALNDLIIVDEKKHKSKRS